MKKVYLSEKADERLIEYIKEKGRKIELVRPNAKLDSAIESHADIYISEFKDELFFGDPGTLGPKYPKDVLYNAVQVGKFFLCSKYTAKELKVFAKKKELELVELKQGYVKCNLVVLDDNHVITEDLGIAKSLREKTDIDVLCINPKEVKLPSYKYGFIGGASGVLDGEVIFNGDLSKHSSFEDMKEYIRTLGLGIKYFSEYELTDIGSIIAEK